MTLRPGWLGATVESFEYKPLSGGYVSDGGIIYPTYSGQQGAAPASLVLKFKAESAEMVETASGTNMYQKELIFYTKMRGVVNKFMPCACRDQNHSESAQVFLSSPSCSCDAALLSPLPGAEILGVFAGAEQHNFCIAMEDLSAEYDGLDAAGLDAGWSLDEALIR